MEPDSPVSEEKTVKTEEGVTASNIKNTVFKCKELVGVKFLIFHGNPSISPFFFVRRQCKVPNSILVKKLLVFKLPLSHFSITDIRRFQALGRELSRKKKKKFKIYFFWEEVFSALKNF